LESKSKSKLKLKLKLKSNKISFILLEAVRRFTKLQNCQDFAVVLPRHNMLPILNKIGFQPILSYTLKDFKTGKTTLCPELRSELLDPVQGILEIENDTPNPETNEAYFILDINRPSIDERLTDIYLVA